MIVVLRRVLTNAGTSARARGGQFDRHRPKATSASPCWKERSMRSTGRCFVSVPAAR